MKNSKYPNGYQTKIAYYQAALSNAVDRLDMEKIKFFTGKLEYFMNREAQLVG